MRSLRAARPFLPPLGLGVLTSLARGTVLARARIGAARQHFFLFHEISNRTDQLLARSVIGKAFSHAADYRTFSAARHGADLGVPHHE